MSSLDLVPSSTIKPARSTRSDVRKELIRNAFTRRTFVKSMMVVAGSTVLVSVEGGLGKVKAFGATAPTHGSCATYRDAQVAHYGSSYASGAGRWWAVCNPYASDAGGGTIGWGQIGNEFCDTDGYHRTDTVGLGGGHFYNYNRRGGSCAGVNAWSWKVNLDTAWQNKRSRRCSDGVRIRLFNGVEQSRDNTVCKQMLPGSNPPATSLPYQQFTPDGCDPGVTSPAGC